MTGNGDHYTRRTLVDSTAFDDIYETHTVRAYQHYVPKPPFQIPDEIKALSGGDAAGMRNPALVQALVGEASEKMQDRLGEIFGSTEDGEPAKVDIAVNAYVWEEQVIRTVTRTRTQIDEATGEETRESYNVDIRGMVRVARAKDDEGKDITVELNEGEFALHVGIAAEMLDGDGFDATRNKSEWSKNVQRDGVGQMAGIMLDFHYSQVKQSMGFAEQDKPIYEKKLWDDDGAWIPPMTMKSVVDLGLSVAVTIASAGTLGPVASAAINLADDLAFAVLDVAGGEKSFGESMAEFGAQSLVKVGTSLIGAGFSGTQNLDGLLTDAIGAGGFGGNVASTMGQGLTSIASSPLNAAVGAMDFSQMGTADFWSQDRFAAGMQAGLTGAFGQMATGFVGDMSEGMLAGDLTGFSQADSAAVTSVASLGGTAAQAGFEYMAFGSTSINILNTRDFGLAPNQAHGLFALTFDKDDGIGGAITGGGHGMSLSTLNEAIAGWDTFVTQTRIRWYDAAGGPEVAEGYEGNTSAAVAFRANYSFGDEAAREQLEGFLSGDMTLRVGAVDDRKGKTTIEDGVRVVDLLSLGLEGDVGSQLQAATVLQWEAHRDGKIGNAQNQFQETLRASFAMQGMAQVLALAYEDDFEMTAEQRDLVDEAGEGWEAFAGHVAGSYDFSEDNWKYTLTEDGFQRTWDGNHKMNLEGFDLDEGQQEFMTSIAGKNMHELTADEMAALQEILVSNGGDAEDVAENLGLLQDVSRTRYDMTDNVALYSGSEVGRGNEFATDGTTDFVRALHRLRQSGIMTLNGANVVAESNGVALTELDDGTILPVTTGGNPAKVTTLYGDRLWPGDDRTNPLFGTWSGFTHSQVDIGGEAMLVAHDEGDATLRWDNSFGLRARVDGETYYTDTGHLAAQSLDDWIAAAMTEGTTVELTGIDPDREFQSDGLRISGLPQATKLGHTGETGYSFGTHADVEYGIVDAYGTSLRIDPVAFWGEQGLVAASGEFASYGDFYITPYAAQYSGLPSLQSVRNSGSIVSGDAGTAFEKLIQYYDNQQFANDESRLNQFKVLMGQAGHDSLASAELLVREYPTSSIARGYNAQWTNAVSRDPYDPHILAELLRRYMMMQENR